MEINNVSSNGMFPIKVVKTTYRDNKAVADELMTLYSQEELNTLLGEVKQYNTDPSNKEVGNYIFIGG